MACRECLAFLSNYESAVERYTTLSTNLSTMAKSKPFSDPKYLKLKGEVETARIECQLAREALRVHQTNHPRP